MQASPGYLKQVSALQNDQIRTAVEEYGDYNVFTLDYPRPNEPTVHIVDHED